MDIMVSLNESEIRFLQQFAKNQHEGAEDNLATREPIFVVEAKREYAAPDGYGDTDSGWRGWKDGNYTKADTPEELVEALTGEKPVAFENAVEYDTLTLENGQQIDFFDIFDENDYFKFYGIEAEKNAEYEIWQPVAFFFTREEAKKYVFGYQKHNLPEARVYAYGLGYSNKGDLPEFRKILMRMGEDLLTKVTLNDI